MRHIVGTSGASVMRSRWQDSRNAAGVNNLPKQTFAFAAT